MTQQSDQPEYPKVEPEIIPPAHSQTYSRTRQPSWGTAADFRQMGGTQRVFVTRLSPFSIAIMLLAFAVLTAAILLALIGAVLLWLPAVALVVGAVIVARVFRRRIF
jgi:uncharacterized membrane protein